MINAQEDGEKDLLVPNAAVRHRKIAIGASAVSVVALTAVLTVYFCVMKRDDVCPSADDSSHTPSPFSESKTISLPTFTRQEDSATKTKNSGTKSALFSETKRHSRSKKTFSLSKSRNDASVSNEQTASLTPTNATVDVMFSANGASMVPLYQSNIPCDDESLLRSAYQFLGNLFNINQTAEHMLERTRRVCARVGLCNTGIREVVNNETVSFEYAGKSENYSTYTSVNCGSHS